MSRDYLDKKINKSGLLRLGRFCGEFKSRFRAACVGFFFFCGHYICHNWPCGLKVLLLDW